MNIPERQGTFVLDTAQNRGINLFLISYSSVQHHRYCCPCSALLLNVFDFILLLYFVLPAMIAAN